MTRLRRRYFWSLNVLLVCFVAFQGWVLHREQQFNDKVRRNSLIWQAFAMNSSQAFIVSDEEGNIKHWSPGATDLFGCTHTEAEGKNISEFMPEDVYAKHDHGIHNSAKMQALMDGHVFTVNCKIRDVYGRVKPVQVRLQGAWLKDYGNIIVAQVQLIDDVINVPNPELDPRTQRMLSQ